jgi:excisionase family DNA binding protein
MSNRPKPLSESELAQAFAPLPGSQPPSAVMSPAQFAALVGLSVKTVYEWLAKGRLANSSRRRGKHVLIIRDRALNELLAGKDWINEPQPRPHRGR